MSHRPARWLTQRSLSITLGLILTATWGWSNWTATGSFSYTNRLYDSRGYTTTELCPIRLADVEVIDASTGTVLATGKTDTNGQYIILVSDMQTRDIAVRVLSSSNGTPDLHLRVVNPLAGGSYYAVQSATAVAHAPALDMDFGLVAAPASIGAIASVDPSSMAFNAYDMGVYMADWIRDMRGARPAVLLTVEWAKSAGVSGSSYDSFGRTLYLADDDGYDDPNILHEIGHFIDEEYAYSQNPNSTHMLTDTSQDMRLSWSEGLATWFSTAILQHFNLPQPQVYIDLNGFSPTGGGGLVYNMETSSPKGGASESGVTAALWDLIDGPGTLDNTPGVDDEPLQRTDKDVWAVIASFQTQPPAYMTIEAFWDRWAKLGKGDMPAMATAFTLQRIDFHPDQAEPNDTLETAYSLTVGGAYADMTFYSALSDPSLDEDFFKFEAVAGTTYYLETGTMMYGRPDPELVLFDMDTHRIIAQHDDIDDPDPSQIAQSDQRASILWTAPESRMYYLLARKSPGQKADGNEYGSYQIRVRSTSSPAPAISRIAPPRWAPGERYPVLIQGSGFVVGAHVAVSVDGVSILSVRWISENLLRAELVVDPAASLGPRMLTVTNPDGQSAIATTPLVAANAPPMVLLSEADMAGGKYELINLGNKPADLGGWKFIGRFEGFADQVFTLPAGATIAAGGTTRITQGNGTDTATEIYVNLVVDFLLQNGESGSMELVDSMGVSCDFVQFVRCIATKGTTHGSSTIWNEPVALSPAFNYTLGRPGNPSDRTGTGSDWTWQAPSLPNGASGRKNLADIFEYNGKPQSAALLGAGTWNGLAISPRPTSTPADVDWYGVPVRAGDGLNASIAYARTAGDLSLAVYPPGEVQTPILISATSADSETVSLSDATTALYGSGIYRLKVWGVSASTANTYQMTIGIVSGVTPTPTPIPTITPTPTPTATPTPSVTPTPTPVPTITPTPVPTPTPTPNPTITPTPEPTPTPTPFPTPSIYGQNLVLDYVDTASAPQGAWVTIWGIGFGQAKEQSHVVIGASTVIRYASWSDRRIDFQVPAAASSGPLRIIVRETESNAIAFTVRPGNIYFVSSSDPQANDFNPGTESLPWRTLARAVQALQPGDVVYVRGGTYAETLAPVLSGGTRPPDSIQVVSWRGGRAR